MYMEGVRLAIAEVAEDASFIFLSTLISYFSLSHIFALMTYISTSGSSRDLNCSFQSRKIAFYVFC